MWMKCYRKNPFETKFEASEMTVFSDQQSDKSDSTLPIDQISNTACRICGSVGKRRFFSAQERQFGIGDQFNYFECAECGSLSNNSVPTQLSKYYPPQYYSFSQPSGENPNDIGWLRRKLRAHRSMFNIYGKDLLGRGIQSLGTDYFKYPWQWFRAAGVTPASAILDNGCGAGGLLRALRDQGFTNLSGVDPFIAQSITEPYLQITKGEIFDLNGSYDLVMFHHSLEHVPEPEKYLKAAASICARGGAILIRIPVSGGNIWRKYGEYWYHLDAPRHLAIPTPLSLKSLGQRCGLQFQEMLFDSEAVCFWGSELYKRGIPAVQPDGQDTISAASPFSENEMKHFRQSALEINQADDGDLAFFIIRKPTLPV